MYYIIKASSYYYMNMFIYLAYQIFLSLKVGNILLSAL
jgi:hypothetical protein